LKGGQLQEKQFLKKITHENEKGKIAEYVRLIVEGSPLDKTYADTYIKLVT
jgi:hypothetical protein